MRLPGLNSQRMMRSSISIKNALCFGNITATYDCVPRNKNFGTREEQSLSSGHSKSQRGITYIISFSSLLIFVSFLCAFLIITYISSTITDSTLLPALRGLSRFHLGGRSVTGGDYSCMCSVYSCAHGDGRPSRSVVATSAELDLDCLLLFL